MTRLCAVFAQLGEGGKFAAVASTASPRSTAAHLELAGWRQSIVSGDNRLYAAVPHLCSFSRFASACRTDLRAQLRWRQFALVSG